VSIGVLVALGAASYEPQLLEALRDDRLHVVRRCLDVPDLLATAASRQAEVALVGLDLRGLDADVVSRIIGEAVAVVGVVPDSTAADEAVMRGLGVDFVCAADDLATVLETVVAAADASSPPRDPQPTDGAARPETALDRAGIVIAVWGPSGAPGRSVVALGLSAELAAVGHDTLVVDADVYGGSLAQMLGMFDESSGLLAATREANAGTLTVASLRRQCRQLGPSLRALTGLPRADRWVEAKSALVRIVLGTCRELADVTVVDCGFCLEVDEEISYDTTAPRRNGATIEILQHADTVIVVGRSDPVGLSRLIRGLGELRAAVPTSNPVVVVNRVRPELGWSRDDIAETISRATGVHELSWLPDDPAACDRAVAHGRSVSELAPGSKLSKGLRLLAAGIVGTRPPASGRLRARLTTRRGARAR
jgi:MinD-like ATPase involved in chromosome partitioning or flagellar assembly